MNIGTFTIPDTRLHSTPLEAVKTIYNKFETREVDYATLASVLGHNTPKSGAFTAKMTVMRAFNLLEGRGEVRVTETGRKIAQMPSIPKEYNEGMIEAVTNIPLWREFYERYTKIGKELPTSDFWIPLREICSVPPEEAKNKAELIRKAYLDDISEIELSIKGDDNQIGGQQDNQQKISGLISFTEMISFKDGGIELKLPKENIREAWEKAKKMIDIYVGIE